jgi:hypothetical protein
VSARVDSVEPVNPSAPATAREQVDVIRDLVDARVGRPVHEIAVVGNAPVAVSRARADRIDAADVVVRMTTFAVDDLEPRVGRRTDVVVLHRATSAGPDTWADHARRVYLVAEPGRRHYEPQNPTPWWPAAAAPVPISNRDVVDDLNRELGYRAGHAVWATTGLVALWTMHRVYPDARLLFAGTSLLDRGAGARRRFAHAWGDPVPVTAEHRLASEAKVLRRGIAAGWLTVLSDAVATGPEE